MTEKDKLSRRKLNIYFALGVVVLAALAAVGVIHFKYVVTEPSGNGGICTSRSISIRH